MPNTLPVKEENPVDLEYWVDDSTTCNSIYSDVSAKSVNSSTLVRLARTKFLAQASKFPSTVIARIAKVLDQNQNLFSSRRKIKYARFKKMQNQIMAIADYPDFVFDVQHYVTDKFTSEFRFSVPITFGIKHPDKLKNVADKQFAIARMNFFITFNRHKVTATSSIGWFGFDSHGLDRFILRITRDPKNIISLLSGNENTDRYEFYKNLDVESFPLAFNCNDEEGKQTLIYAPMREYKVDIPAHLLIYMTIDSTDIMSIQDQLRVISSYNKSIPSKIFLTRTLLPESYLNRTQIEFCEWFDEAPIDEFYNSYKRIF